jgi:SpoVK/Ycf46/Vps4 family AAA+-type ATPase
MSPPTAKERAQLLSSLLRTTVTSENQEAMITEEEVQKIAELCVGYVPADLSALVRKSWHISLQENGDGQNVITFSHLDAARHHVVASALRDASLAAPPKMTWDSVAGDPGGAKTALRQAIEWPRLKAREFELLGLHPPRGILLHGPPGCAKTTLARAAAGASGVAFLALSPAEVYASSYVGEAEAVVRRAFALARSAAPCILFFDEIDSIFGGSNNDGGRDGRGSSAEARVLSTFLNEMDGVDVAGAGKDGVLVLGATNRPWTLDSALLRPGRLGDKIIYLPPPDEPARQSIFETQFKTLIPKEAPQEWDWNILLKLSEGMTGAELVGACQEAKMHWIREAFLTNDKPVDSDQCDVHQFHQGYIVDALQSVKPLLSSLQALEEFRVFQNYDKRFPD